MFGNGKIIEAEGRCTGRIAHCFSGENGFGYDPIFLYGDRSFAEISAEEKNKVSHRAEALRDLIKKLKEL